MKRILLTDDEEAILVAFKKILQGPDIAVDTADSVDTACSLLLQQAYDAIIVDLRLEGTASLVGLDLVRFARHHAPFALIIVVTAYGDQDIEYSVLGSGASYYLEKPVSPSIVRNILLAEGICSKPLPLRSLA